MSKRFDPAKAFGADDERKSLDLFKDTWFKNGWNEPTQSRIKFNDLIATPTAPIWMPKVVEEIVREPIEPTLMIARLLDRIAYTPAARITYPASGALTAGPVGEGMAYPEEQLQVSPGTITINVGKYGIAFKITEEMREYSQYDVINMHIRQAKLALDRLKEKQGFDMITAMGVSLFDNKSPTTSVYGTCTGRSITGAGNGSCRMEDLLKAYGHVMVQGYVPNVLLMHPFAWSIWQADPLLQTIVKNTGNGQWFTPVKMPNRTLPWDRASQGGLGMGGGSQFTPSEASSVSGDTPSDPTGTFDGTLQSAPTIPNYFPYPLTVLVSPFLPYDEYNRTCDIILCDSRNLGCLVVGEDVSSDQWNDPEHDIMKVKLREKYGYGIYADGLSIGVLKNVPIRANEIALPVQPTISAAGSLAELDPATAIAGL